MMMNIGKTQIVAGAALLVLSMAVNVLQAQRIQSLLDPAVADELVGTTPSAIEGWSLTGEPVRVVPGLGQTTVLYYFSRSCAWCESNWRNVKQLISDSKGRYQVIGLTEDRGLEKFLEERGITMEIVEGISADTVEHYQLRGTPHTVVVDRTGTIARSWRGVFTGRIQRQAEDLFGVTLSGLQSAAGTVSAR